MITVTSNRAQFVEQANDTASVFRRRDVQAEVKRGLAREIRQMNKLQILGRGIGESGPFPALSPLTIKRKGHDQPLVATGSLFRKATRGGRVTAGYIPAFQAFTFNFTIDHPAIDFLQKGTKNMPRRPVIDPTARQTEKLSDAIWVSLKRAWRKIGWFDKMGTARLTGFDTVTVE